MPTLLLPRGHRLSVIVLAAGGSSRLGQPKQLLCYRGERLIVRAARLADRMADHRAVVVLGASHLRLRGVLRREIPAARVAYNSNWREGMAGSLRAGLAALPHNAAAAMILTVDQPLVGRDDLQRLVRAWRKRPRVPAAAIAGHRTGVPAIIPRRFFPALRAVRGDAGARHLLRKLTEISVVAIPGAAIDIDTPEAAAALTRPGPAGASAATDR